MADEYRYENIHLLLGEPNPHLRQSLKAALFANGFRGITDCHSVDKLQECLTDSSVDVMLCDVELPGGDFCDTIHRMRHHTLGVNPFVLTLATSNEPTVGQVKRVIDSGVDDLLVKPLSIELLLDRLTFLAKSRKPFVVTHDYIGPDRRKAPRPGEGQKTELIEVPNPLRSKALGYEDTAVLQRMIDVAAKRLNEEKMRRYAVQVNFLVQRVTQFFNGEGTRDQCQSDMERLLFVGEDLTRRLNGANFGHVGELAQSLVARAEQLAGNEQIPDQRDIDLLQKLSDSITKAFSSEKNTSQVAKQISAAVNKHTARAG